MEEFYNSTRSEGNRELDSREQRISMTSALGEFAAPPPQSWLPILVVHAAVRRTLGPVAVFETLTTSAAAPTISAAAAWLVFATQPFRQRNASALNSPGRVLVTPIR
jgi:hypothetical protein